MDEVMPVYSLVEDMTEQDQEVLFKSPSFMGDKFIEAYAMMHHELFGMPGCAWAGGVMGDMVRCKHG